MAVYFAQFELTESADSCYDRLVVGIRRSGAMSQTTFCTLNYECLLEFAIGRDGTPATYLAPDRSIPNGQLLKPHGSCNFVPPPERRNVQALSFDLSANPDGASIADYPALPVRPVEVAKIYNDGQELAIPPIICAYAPGKRTPVSKGLIQQLRDRWRSTCERADRIFIIGARVNADDDHVFAPVLESKASLWFVGADQDFAHLRELRLKRANHLGSTFDQALPAILKRLSPR